MIILHYGAGNIGRGFIAPILLNSGFVTEFYFIDNNKELINKLKNSKEYKIKYLDESNKVDTVKGYKALLSNKLESNLSLETIDVITTSIDLGNLKHSISQVISIIETKQKSNTPLIIMCCENGEKVSSFFKNQIEEHHVINNDLIKFVDVMVDRIVPNEVSDDLSIKVETYYSWVANENAWSEQTNKFETITYTNIIDAEICKKVWMLNVAHAALAWKKLTLTKFEKKYINITLNDAKEHTLLYFLQDYLKEISKIVSVEFNYDKEKLEDFRETIIKRFTNNYIKDDFERVARNTIKKLQLDERIMKPFLIAKKNDISFVKLKETIKNAFSYNNTNDEDGTIIQNLLQENKSLDYIIKKLVKNIDDSIIQLITN